MRTNPRRRWRRMTIAVLGLTAAWILLNPLPASSEVQAEISVPFRGFLAPEISLQTPDGETVALSELRGQPVLVNIWASWCAPCRAEMPAIERVFREYEQQGLIVLAVNATNQDSLRSALDFVDQYGLTFPILLDTTGVASRAYQLRALPSSYFIGRDGVIQEVVIGGPMSEALLRTRVQRLVEGGF